MSKHFKLIADSFFVECVNCLIAFGKAQHFKDVRYNDQCLCWFLKLIPTTTPTPTKAKRHWLRWFSVLVSLLEGMCAR